VSARASTKFLPEIVTVPAGLVARVPAKAEPSDIDTAMAATIVPAAVLSGRDTALGVKVTTAGVGAGGGAGGGGAGGLATLTWTGIEPETVTPF
jgi:hypothetical protein